ncbi:sensor histidine kinase [Rugosimonospora africana]|uniref:sensor histidine kinase n=1 Tax=Rugosimonospora africana TaxID=556532 RepID=UPI001944E977|nr:sensor histidine kinase [Rugosimonospora africana]
MVVGEDERLVGHGGIVGLAVGLLLVGGALSTFGPGGDPALSVVATVVLTAVAGCWLAALALPRFSWAGRPALPVVYYAGLLVVLSVLVMRSPWFMVVSWVACVYAFLLFEARWAFAGAAAAGVALTVAQAGSPVPESRQSLPLFLISLVAPLLAAGWYLGRESDARRRLIDRLTLANRELAASSAANAALQDRLLAQSCAAGVQQERQRMAREIHDTLAQDLSAVVAQLEVALSADPGEQGWRARVTQARDLARDGLVEARRSVRAMGPRPLDTAALPEALHRLVDQWRERAGVDASCRVDDDLPALPDRAEAELLRVAQTALANVAEHAHASRVRVSLSSVGDAVLLDVRDDGAGFDPAHAVAGTADRGFGIGGMRQRLGEVGGHLEIESAPGAGTAVCARVPIGSGVS